jgi:hypothetical protein
MFMYLDRYTRLPAACTDSAAVKFCVMPDIVICSLGTWLFSILWVRIGGLGVFEDNVYVN